MSHIDESLPAAQPHASGKVDMVCPTCGKEFFPRVADVNRGRGIYCSFRCHVTRPPKPLKERFLEKILIGDGCWLWTGGLSSKGYGQLTIGSKYSKEFPKKNLTASRVAWEVFNGPIPDGLCVLHDCDEPACVRIDHLFIGTNDDNSKDAVSKGRMQHGINRHNAILNDAIVVEIRRLARSGLSQILIGLNLGFTRDTVAKVVQRKNWKHVPDEITASKF